MAKYVVGDIVRLKSGGPDMTIAAVLTDDSESQVLRFNFIAIKQAYPDTSAAYNCMWFDGVKDKSAVYPEEVLELTV